MATRRVVTYVSDLSGADIADRARASVPFGLDGVAYEIDLTEVERHALLDALAPFIAVARKEGPRSRKAAPTEFIRSDSSSTAPSSQEIRAWASENGHDVPARGRIPELVREAYRIAH